MNIFFVICSQIATLKAALARKEGDSEHSQNSQSSSPERLRMKQGSGDSSRRQSLDCVSNIQVIKLSALVENFAN